MFQASRRHGLSWTQAGTSLAYVQTRGRAVCSAKCHEHKQRAGLGPRPHSARLCRSSLGNHILPVSVMKTLATDGRFVKRLLLTHTSRQSPFECKLVGLLESNENNLQAHFRFLSDVPRTRPLAVKGDTSLGLTTEAQTKQRGNFIQEPSLCFCCSSKQLLFGASFSEHRGGTHKISIRL